jgi:predicted permease
MLQQLQFAFGITGPILLLLLLGFALKKIQLIDDGFVNQANKLVFNIALPAMLFFALSANDITQSIDVPFVASGFLGTLLLIALLIVFSKRVSANQRGVFIQGSYRGNKAVVAVALAIATFGDDILPIISVYLAVVTTLYNVIAVWVLNAKGALKRIVNNPIIIGIVLGSLASVTNMPIPQVIIKTGDYTTAMTLPIALICIGASLRISSLQANSLVVSVATGIKLVVSPVLVMGIGWMMGVRGDALMLLFFLSAAPTASASYVMAQEMTNSGELAAEIIATTTALSVISLTLGMALLSWQS